MSEQELSMAVGYELDNQQHVNLLQQDMRLLRASLQKFEYTARVKLAGLDEKLNRYGSTREHVRSSPLANRQRRASLTSLTVPIHLPSPSSPKTASRGE